MKYGKIDLRDFLTSLHGYVVHRDSADCIHDCECLASLLDHHPAPERIASLKASAQELEWWRNFGSKFAPDTIPKPGDALLAHKFELSVLMPGGGRATWKPRSR